MDTEILLGVLGITICAMVMKKLQKRRLPRRYKCRPLNQNRKEKNAYVYFLRMKECDPEQFFKLTRMTLPVFDQLHGLVKPLIAKAHRSDGICSEQRLAITLHTFVCPTELIALDDRIDDFKALNAEVIGCSIDSHFSHLGWMNTKRSEGGLGKLRYPLLSDINKDIARDYDVLLENDGVALRGMFIIDPNGILRQITVNDLPIGRSVDEVLRLIEALRFVEEHGEVCPANWRKGEKTIKPDPKGSQDYFKSTHS